MMENTLVTVLNFINHNDIMSQVERNNFRKSYEVMVGHMYMAMDDNEVDITDEHKVIIHNSINNLYKFLQTNYNKKYKEFITEYIKVCLNWNKLAKSKLISDDINSLQSMTSYIRSNIRLVDEVIPVYEELRLTRHFSPPTFNIAKKYLDGLEDKFSRGGKK